MTRAGSGVTTAMLCGTNSVGRVPASQAGCREFESRVPLRYSSVHDPGLAFSRSPVDGACSTRSRRAICTLNVLAHPCTEGVRHVEARLALVVRGPRHGRRVRGARRAHDVKDAQLRAHAVGERRAVAVADMGYRRQQVLRPHNGARATSPAHASVKLPLSRDWAPRPQVARAGALEKFRAAFPPVR